MKPPSYLRRLKGLRRRKRLREFNPARKAKKQARYAKFMRSPEWKAQKKRVHIRDGWQCTEVVDGERCGYTKADGPLHAHHEKYAWKIEETPDKDVRTKCPRHHDRIEAEKFWKRRFR